MHYLKKSLLIFITFLSATNSNMTLGNNIGSLSNISPLPQAIIKFDSGEFILKLAKEAAWIALMVYIQVKMLEAPGFKVYQPGDIKENFKNVAGNDEAKDSFSDIVEYLKNPEIYKAIGARPTTGILLTGGPGTGKTLLARALAGEANCSFIYASGGEFNGKFVGSGVERIQKLFYQARNQYTWTLKKTPCIIFIDEFEVLARQRGSYGDNYSDQTVNQLLTELDGFVKSQNHPIIVIAATNYPEKIDKAILRPGRIDRTIHINAPDWQDRLEVLQIHLNKVVHNKSINLNTIAQQTIGFTGADLEGIVISAARIAVNRKAKKVEQQDLQEAYEIKVLGVASKRPLTTKETEIVAYHEAGHALIHMLLTPDEIVNKITILPRGNALGVTHTLRTEEMARLQTKDYYLNHIAMLFGGRAAEELIFNVVTTGPSSDLSRATELARTMLKHYAMGNNLIVESSGHCDSLSTNEINTQIEKILEEQYARTKELLKTHMDSLQKLTKALLQHKTLLHKDIIALGLV